MSGSGSCNQVSESLPKEDTGDNKVGKGKRSNREKPNRLNLHIITICLCNRSCHCPQIPI